MSLKTTDSAELRSKLAQLQKSEEVLANAGMPFPEELKTLKDSIEAELKNRIGDVVADATREELQGYYAQKFAGQKFDTAVTIIHTISTDADGNTVVEISAKGKATRSSSAGSGSTGARGPVTRKHVNINGKIFESASAGLKHLKDAGLVGADYGNADSAVRVLERLSKVNTALNITFVEATSEAAIATEAPAEADAELAEAPKVKGK